jgi:NAD(P)-dependent dehydrogenase (short-subunit alcohol dehydrogenase family)
MITLKNKTALITGSSRGVGQQIAIGLAQLGCHIIVHGRAQGNGDKTLALLREFPVNTFDVYGELSDEDTVRDVISQVRALNIDVDILYNNAALGAEYREDYWSHGWDTWMQIFKVNVFAMYSLCGAFMPGMIERGFGRVVNLTSGIKHEPELAPYGASKWAVDKMTDDISCKLHGTGVRINTLDPGWLRTDMGGEHAEHPVEAVLPGGLAPALVEDDGPNGQFFSAINHELDMDAFHQLKL